MKVLALARRRWRISGLAAAVAVGMLAGGSDDASPGQPPGVTFKVDINYVEIPAVVVDPNGRFVDTLQQSDFQVYEDGRRQTIASFTLVKTGVEPVEPPVDLRSAIAPDVQTNAAPFDGRLYVVLMDDLHVDAAHTEPTRQAARLFLETQLGTGDLAAVVCTSGRTGGSQDFTSDRSLLVAAVDQFMGRRLNSPTRNRIESFNNNNVAGALNRSSLETRPTVDDEERERLTNAQATLATIRAISGSLAAIRGRRKAVVLFSEGIDAAISNINAGEAQGEGTDFNVGNLLPGASGQIQRDAEDAMSAATRADVSIYGIDAFGLKPGAGTADVAIPTDVDPTARLSLDALGSEVRLQQESLRRLSTNTGGFAAINTNDLASAFSRIREDNSRYYLLGYYPAATRPDGRFHRLDVKVDVPGATVRARAGYVALRERPGQAPASADLASPSLVHEALDSPLPVPGLRLTAFAAPFKGPTQNASVTVVVQVDGRDIRFTQTGEQYDAGLVLSILATDESGRATTSLTRTVTMPLRPESHRQVSENGIRIVERIDLPPGRVRLRIAAQDVDSQRVGSVHYDLDVPDFSASALTMSGLVLTSSLAGTVPTVPSDQLDGLKRHLPGPPTVARAFRPAEVLGLMAQIYDGDPELHTLDVSTRVNDTGGHEVVRHEDQHSSAEFSGHDDGLPYATMVPLSGLPPGSYISDGRGALTAGPIASGAPGRQVRDCASARVLSDTPARVPISLPPRGGDCTRIGCPSVGRRGAA